MCHLLVVVTAGSRLVQDITKQNYNIDFNIINYHTTKQEKCMMSKSSRINFVMRQGQGQGWIQVKVNKY